MYTFDNANISFHKAAENKRFHEEVLAFSMSKEDELLRACEEVETLTYSQGPYTVFKVWEPKERLIMALPFYDRVVQHMIVNAIGPVFISIHVPREGHDSKHAQFFRADLRKSYKYPAERDALPTKNVCKHIKTLG